MRKLQFKGLGMIIFALIATLCFLSREEIVKADDFSGARTISVNQAVSGSIQQGNDYEQDYYRFTVSSAGCVTVNFKNPLQKDSEGYWNVALYNADYEQIDETTIYGNKTSTNMTAMGVSPGTYYIKVNSTSWREARSTDKYSITANFSASNYWEKEFNDDFVTATKINLNTSYYGTTRAGYDYEKDYYAVNVSGNGFLTVNFQNPSQKDSEEYWHVYLYNNEYKEIASVTIKGNRKSTNLPAIGVGKGTYYIQINSTSWRGAGSTDRYTITANFTSSNYWEKEFNDDFVTATKISLNTSYYGTTRGGYDYESDYYKFNTTAKGSWSIGMSTPNLKDSENYWTMYLYDAAYNEIAKIDINGNIKYHVLRASLKKGTYYIKINSTSWREAGSTDKYSVKVYKSGTLKPVATRLNGKIKAKKKGFTVKWAKAKKSISGYQIQYSLKKNFKKAKYKNVSKSKTSLTVKKLGKKKKYYVRVRTYITYHINGVYTKVYSSWSSAKKVKTK